MAATDKERRNVAELMRGEAADFRRLVEEHGGAWTVDLGDVPAIFQDIMHYAGLDYVVRADALFDRLADLIEPHERTWDTRCASLAKRAASSLREPTRTLSFAL